MARWFRAGTRYATADVAATALGGGSCEHTAFVATAALD